MAVSCRRFHTHFGRSENRAANINANLSQHRSVGDQLREWDVCKYDSENRPLNKVYSSSDGGGVAESLQVTSYDGDNPRLQGLPATDVVATAKLLQKSRVSLTTHAAMDACWYVNYATSRPHASSLVSDCS